MYAARCEDYLYRAQRGGLLSSPTAALLHHLTAVLTRYEVSGQYTCPRRAVLPRTARPSFLYRKWAPLNPSPSPFAAPPPDSPLSLLHANVAAAALVVLPQVGAFDPITRQPVREEQLVPNTSLRAAIELYLEEHPWAWGEVK